MLLPITCHLFVDEVGNGDLRGAATDPNIRYLSLTGLITKQQTHAELVQPGLETLKAAVFGPGNEVILHRREIVRREGPFACLRDDDLKAEFDRGILQIIEGSPYIVVTVTIDKREHLARYSRWHFDPYHYCLRLIIERYVMWLDRLGLRRCDY